MQIYNWSYREWNYQNKLHQNMSGEEILIPQAPIVTKETLNTIEEKDDADNICEPRCMQFMTHGDRGTTLYSVFENSDGYLCLEIQYSDGEHIFTKPIIDCIHMRAHLVCEPDDKKRVVCIISLNDFSSRIILSGRRISADDFEKTLTLKNIPILVSEKKRKVVMEMVFMYLMGNATVSELPDSLGWSRRKTGTTLAEREMAL